MLAAFEAILYPPHVSTVIRGAGPIFSGVWTGLGCGVVKRPPGTGLGPVEVAVTVVVRTAATGGGTALATQSSNIHGMSQPKCVMPPHASPTAATTAMAISPPIKW